MRKLMWFTIGFSAACAVSLWLLPQDSVYLCVAVMAIGCLFISTRNPVFYSRIAAMILWGSLAGMVWFSAFQQCYLEDIVSLDGSRQVISITATDYSERTEQGAIRVYGSTVCQGKTYKTCAYLDETVSLAPGDRITAAFQLEMTAVEKQYYAGNGVFLLAYQKEEGQIARADKHTFRQMASILSERLEKQMAGFFTQREFAFAKALLLGETEDIDYALDTQLKVSGIRHVVAVSGLHIAVLFGLFRVITLRQPVFTALLGLPVLAMFTAMVGFTPSVCRACLMTALMMLGLCIDREYDGPTALAFAVLAMLLGNPMAVASVSLQLSAASVTGIFLFCKPIYRTLTEKWKADSKWMAALRKWTLSSVSVTLSAMFFTTPLCAVHFGMISLIGIVTNILTLWAVSIIFCGIFAVCAVSLVWHGGAVFLAGLVSCLMHYVLKCVQILSAFPLAAVYTDSIYIAVWIVFCYCLVGVFLLIKHRSVTQLTLCALFALMTAVLFSWMVPWCSGMQMMVLDVGQGQSIVLQAEGRTFLVDCGGDSDEATADIIASTLLSQGIHRLDGIVITHYDRDHAGALPYLLTRLDTDYLIAPYTQQETVLPSINGRAIQTKEDMRINLKTGSIQIFASGYWGDGNENSLCVLFEWQNCAILITGDRSSLGEKLLLKKIDLPKVDVLIAGHHGSNDATCRELLDTVQPDIVMISVGEDNLYGHPHGETLDRLEEYGCEVYRTDQNGTLRFRR